MTTEKTSTEKMQFTQTVNEPAMTVGDTRRKLGKVEETAEKMGEIKTAIDTVMEKKKMEQRSAQSTENSPSGGETQK